MSVTLSAEHISSSHASLIRSRFRYWTNVEPVCRRKKRVNVLTLMPANSATSASRSAPGRFCRRYASTWLIVDDM
ncbi:Uncharacterised protein [Burkholderia pseudomallei]|nr:Uncharacterised protein [Burkholderia pseudomallei]